MSTDAPTIPQTPEWKLVCEAVRGATYDTLTTHQKGDLLDTLWDMTDAYGDYVPDEWDWSGIRDSTPATQEHMGQMVRRMLTAWGKMPRGFA